MSTNANRNNHWRGHPIIMIEGVWHYADCLLPVRLYPSRDCKPCRKINTREGHDACLGTLKGAMNACCGHGVSSEAYVQFSEDFTLRGDAALAWIAATKDTRPQHINKPARQCEPITTITENMS